MKKLALFVTAALIVASPAMAQNKKSKAAPKQPEMADWQKQNDNSYRLVRDSLPMWLPSWAQPIYHGAIKPGMEADAKPAAKKKAKAKTAAKTN